MIISPSPFGTTTSRNISTAHTRKRVADLELQARLVEELIPTFKDERDRQFYREVVQSYRAVAREILRKAWSDDKGQDIGEYAVMLAVILVIVVGTIRMVGSNANTVFSQAASSIQ
jgi:Flp pilus assembly pilin Flp